MWQAKAQSDRLSGSAFLQESRHWHREHALRQDGSLLHALSRITSVERIGLSRVQDMVCL